MSSTQHLPKLTGRVLWLIPSEPHFSIYQKEIGRLARQFNTAPFSPHLTMGGLPDEHFASTVLKIRDALDQKSYDLSLNYTSVNCSSSPYQNLVQSLSPHQGILKLQSHLQAAIPSYNPKNEYHISLLYGRVPCADLKNEIRSLTPKLPDNVLFSKACLIQLSGTPELWDIVWETSI